MSTVTSTTPSAWFRWVMIAIAIVVVLIPIFGLRLLEDDSELQVAPTGTLTLASGNRLLFLADGHVAALPLGTPANPSGAGQPTIAELQCAQVYAAAGTGICLRKTTALTWSATVLDQQLESIGTTPLEGMPLLARVSPSGHMVAWSSLTRGSGVTGSFDAVTSILDTRSEAVVADLGSFTVTVDGKASAARDRQVWGVTFADDNRFYASLLTGGVRYLVDGDVAERTLTAIARDVTSPALSPDRSHIAFVRRDQGHWQLQVMHLGTRRVHALADQRGVTDQPAWIGDRTVIYTIRSADRTPSIWSIPADGTGRPALLLDHAESPSPL